MNGRVDIMRQEMQDVLEKNILQFWLDKMIDHENGGFYGRIDGSGQLHPEAEKGVSKESANSARHAYEVADLAGAAGV